MHLSTTLLSIGTGMLGGLGQFFLDIQLPFEITLIHAIITSACCAATGLVIREVYEFIKRKIKQ